MFKQLDLLLRRLRHRGIVFQMGKQSEKLDFVGLKVEAQEKKEEYSNQKIAELCSKVDILQTDISYMKEDIQDIKINISKYCLLVAMDYLQFLFVVLNIQELQYPGPYPR